ncbi:hypothetical protein [Chryseosolibacter indicus]|uniref:DUF4468 domain-containing protein n=1 Tax=Chryseosolibacter indicus TaxID=2782351 RepID=A0ABS5VSA6_9BACT|nr:hypothetical protein [Chryseosolibacter indicus]MBT1704297.1 hypothetical protein [Chryseosolibacter indicus]
MAYNIFSRIAFIIILIVLCNACASTEALHKGFTKRKTSLKYINDTKWQEKTTPYTVCVDKVLLNDGKFRGPGLVRKIKSSVIPLIIYTGWKADHDYRLGQDGIKEDIGAFIQCAMIEESNRSGIFKADTLQSVSNFKLEIEVESLGVSGPYHQEGFFVFLYLVYVWSFQEAGGQSQAYSKFHYTLKKDGITVLDAYAKSEQQSERFHTTYPSKKIIRSAFNTSMVEALSLTFKKNIETIVKDVNRYLLLQQKEQMTQN